MLTSIVSMLFGLDPPEYSSLTIVGTCLIMYLVWFCTRELVQSQLRSRHGYQQLAENLDLGKVLSQAACDNVVKSLVTPAAWWGESRVQNFGVESYVTLVYMMQDTGTRPVIKKKRHGGNEVGLLLSVVREAGILSVMSHPNLVKLVGTCTVPDNMCVLIEQCDGGSVYDLLVKPMLKPPLLTRVSLAHQIACGMAHVQGKQVLHRDLRLENCFLTADGVVQIGDFGLARFKRDALAAQPSCKRPDGDPAPDAFNFGQIVISCVTCQAQKVDHWHNQMAARMSLLALKRQLARVNEHSTSEASSQPGGMLRQVENLYAVAMECSKQEALQRPTFQTICRQLETLISFECVRNICIRNPSEFPIPARQYTIAGYNKQWNFRSD